MPQRNLANGAGEHQWFVRRDAAQGRRRPKEIAMAAKAPKMPTEQTTSTTDFHPSEAIWPTVMRKPSKVAPTRNTRRTASGPE